MCFSKLILIKPGKMKRENFAALLNLQFKCEESRDLGMLGFIYRQYRCSSCLLVGCRGIKDYWKLKGQCVC